MKTSVQNYLNVPIITIVLFIIPVHGAELSISASKMFPFASTTASLTCSIPSFTGGAEWIKSGSSLTLCQSGLCIPSSSARYQYSTNVTAITVTISSLDLVLDEGTWTCSHNGGADKGVFNLIVYKIPSVLFIDGPTSSLITGSVTVHLSVSTGCIHPVGSSQYNISWKYVEVGSTAEKLFETGITQNFTSSVGCANTENNLTFNLYITNNMNTRSTTLYISQIKMIFTMAQIDVPAALNVTYNITVPETTTRSSSSTATTTTERKTTQTLGTTSLVTTSTTEINRTTQTLVTTAFVTRSTTDNNGTDSQQLAVIIGASVGGSVFLAIITIVIFVIRGRNKRRESRKELKDNKYETELEQNKYNQAANSHAKVKEETLYPKEEHEVIKSNPNKEMSKAQMQSSTHSSYQASASHQDSNDKSLTKENEVGETKYVKPEIHIF